MEEDFYALLAGHTALTDLVPANKITPGIYTQGVTGTVLRFQVIDSATGLHMRGSDGLTSSLMQIDIRGDSATAAKAVRDVLIGRHRVGGLLHPYRGVMGATEFQLIQLRSDRGVRFENTPPQSFYIASLDFDIWSRAVA